MTAPQFLGCRTVTIVHCRIRRCVNDAEQLSRNSRDLDLETPKALTSIKTWAVTLLWRRRRGSNAPYVNSRSLSLALLRAGCRMCMLKTKSIIRLHFVHYYLLTYNIRTIEEYVASPLKTRFAASMQTEPASSQACLEPPTTHHRALQALEVCKYYHVL